MLTELQSRIAAVLGAESQRIHDPKCFEVTVDNINETTLEFGYGTYGEQEGSVPCVEAEVTCECDRVQGGSLRSSVEKVTFHGTMGALLIQAITDGQPVRGRRWTP